MNLRRIPSMSLLYILFITIFVVFASSSEVDDDFLSKKLPLNASRISRVDFSDDFIFGVATSAYQIEGGANEAGRGPCNWDVFSKRQPDKIKGGSNGNNAVNSYHLYKEDVQILKKLGLDAYRLSISWSRLLPGGKLSGGINKEGIKYYNNLIDELVANGIKPFVTLFHWDFPQALDDEYGGFLSHKSVKDFAEYAELCFWEFGDRVKNWITLNEPFTLSEGGYSSGLFAPGRGPSVGNPGTEPYLVTHYQLLAHAAAVELYRTKFQKSQKGMIGITLVSHWKEPLNDNEADRRAAKRALDFMFGWFMEPLTSGDYPESMKQIVGSRLPKFTAEESQKLKGSYDFLGLNYYTALYVTDAPRLSGGRLSYETDPQVYSTYEKDGKAIGPKAASDWLYIYPEGMRKLLLYTKKTYNVSLIYITENGIDEPNNVSLTLSEARVDTFRIKHIQDHLFYLRQAIDEGVNVKGYFVWSLLDNFEWVDGFTVRFGIIHVDYNDNFARFPKDSAIWLMNNFHKKLSKHPHRVKD